MFIELLECPDAEFSGRRFLVQSDETIRAILATSAAYAVINPQMGATGIERPVPWPRPETSAEAHLRTMETVSQATTALRTGFATVPSGLLSIEALAPVADEIADCVDASPDVFLKVTRLKKKDEVTYVHSIAVGALMMRLARDMDFDETTVRELGLAGLLHDVGKLMIPNAILNKNGALEGEEKRLVRSHPALGHRLLQKQANVSQIVLDICLHHHEMLDGSGYPLGLEARDLSPEIRIATVCDVFEALTSARPYKRPWSTRDALDWMYERGHLFDQKLVIRLGSIVA
jgi:putative nucleotidyltransferase with HDIG domain